MTNIEAEIAAEMIDPGVSLPDAIEAVIKNRQRDGFRRLIFFQAAAMLVYVLLAGSLIHVAGESQHRERAHRYELNYFEAKMLHWRDSVASIPQIIVNRPKGK